MGRGGQLRVLVVDDNRDAAEALALLVGMMNHSVKVTTRPEEVIEVVQAYRPHVVFLDLGMPAMDGHELCRRLRAKFGFENLCLVALTGHGAPRDRARSRHAGFDAHLLKPPSPELVQSTIDELREPRGRF